MYEPILCCLRNLYPPAPRDFKAFHKTASAGVALFLSAFRCPFCFLSFTFAEYRIFRFLYSPHPCPSPEMGGERLTEAKLYNPNGYYILNHHVYNGIYPHLLSGKEQELFNPTYPLSFSAAPCVPARWRNRRARRRHRCTWRGNGSWGNSARCLPARPRARRRNRSVPFR